MPDVSYNYSPGDNVYVINTLGPNATYPYWGYPYASGWPYNGPIGYNDNYPNGFTSTTPAIQAGVVLQTRILFTKTAPTQPTIMYDVRINNEMGTTTFPENLVFPANPPTAGSQIIDFDGVLTGATDVVSGLTASNVFLIDGKPTTVIVDLSQTPTIANVIAEINNAIGFRAVLTLNNGDLKVTSNTKGSSSSVYIAPNGVEPGIFDNLPNFVAYDSPRQGCASGLDQATAYYETLVKK